MVFASARLMAAVLRRALLPSPHPKNHSRPAKVPQFPLVKDALRRRFGPLPDLPHALRLLVQTGCPSKSASLTSGKSKWLAFCSVESMVIQRKMKKFPTGRPSSEARKKAGKKSSWNERMMERKQDQPILSNRPFPSGFPLPMSFLKGWLN